MELLVGFGSRDKSDVLRAAGGTSFWIVSKQVQCQRSGWPKAGGFPKSAAQGKQLEDGGYYGLLIYGTVKKSENLNRAGG